MNFGGIIAGALGGGAQAVGQIADGVIAARQREEQDMRLEQRQIEGEKRRSLLNREEAAAAAAEKLRGEEDRMKRYAKSADEVDARAKQIGTERDVKALQIPDGQYGPQVTPEVVDTFSKGQRANYEFQGVLTKPTGSGLIMDKINAARDVGADPMLRKDLKDEYGQQVGAEFKAAQADRQERDLARKEAADDNRFKTSFMQAQASLQQAQAAATRAEKTGSAQASGDAKTSATQAINSARETIDKMTQPGLGVIKMKDGVPTGTPENVELYNNLKSLLKNATKSLNSKFVDQPASPVDEPKPTPAQSGPPVGTVVNGYKFKGGDPKDKTNWVK